MFQRGVGSRPAACRLADFSRYRLTLGTWGDRDFARPNSSFRCGGAASNFSSARNRRKLIVSALIDSLACRLLAFEHLTAASASCTRTPDKDGRRAHHVPYRACIRVRPGKWENPWHSATARQPKTPRSSPPRPRCRLRHEVRRPTRLPAGDSDPGRTPVINMIG